MKENVWSILQCKRNAKTLVLFVIISAMVLALCGCVSNQGNGDDSTTNPTVDIAVDDEMEHIDLGNRLLITSIGKYAGIYMEDGSDEVVSGMLMLILKNDNEQDLQLARIELEYEDFTAEFEVTNLPAGESVVLLEKNRQKYVDEEYSSASAKNVVFFPEKMSLCQDQLEISVAKGNITVKNLTEDTMGEIYIYYKNSAVDLLYGGITYRAKVDAGLKPGSVASVMTGHYNPDSSTIVNVQILPTPTGS